MTAHGVLCICGFYWFDKINDKHIENNNFLDGDKKYCPCLSLLAIKL